MENHVFCLSIIVTSFIRPVGKTCGPVNSADTACECKQGLFRMFRFFIATSLMFFKQTEFIAP